MDREGTLISFFLSPDPSFPPLRREPLTAVSLSLSEHNLPDAQRLFLLPPL